MTEPSKSTNACPADGRTLALLVLDVPRNPIVKLLLAILLALGTTLSSAADWKTLSGRVVGVVAGDTVDVLDVGRRVHRVRLMGIDSPERRQPYYARAKQLLAELVFERDVEVRWRHFDRSKRPIGQVLVDGRDINLELVTTGYAWWFAAFQRQQLPSDRRAYSDAEAAARKARAGLWAAPNPIAPWDWRRGKR